MFQFLYELTKKMHPRISYNQSKIFWIIGLIGFLLFTLVALISKWFHNNAIDNERTKKIAAGSDFIISSLTFMCIEIAPAIKIAIPAAAGNINSL